MIKRVVQEGKYMPECAPRSVVTKFDPMVEANERLMREIANFHDLLDVKIKLISTRLDGMDRATALLADGVNRVPSDIDKQITHTNNLFDERIGGLKSETTSLGKGIQLQFDERDIRSRA